MQNKQHMQTRVLTIGTTLCLLGNSLFGGPISFDPTLRQSADVSIEDGQLDAFSRLGVAQPTTLFDNQFSYDLQPFIWEATTNNGAGISHLPLENAAQLSIPETNVTSTASLVTRQYWRYQPGKAQQIFITFVCGASTNTVVKRIGYGDSSDGIFFQQDTNGVSIVKLSSTTGSVQETTVGRSSWNLNTIPTLDHTKAQIFVIDLQYLGVGRVRCGFDIDGKVIWVHEFLHANSVSSVYMKSANLPVRYTISGQKASSLKAICASVISSGGFEDERGYIFAIGNTSDVALSTTTKPIIAIRPKLTFNSITNRSQILPKELEFLGGNAPTYVELVYGGTVSGGTWTSVDVNSTVEYSTDVTFSSTGTVISAFFVASSGGVTRNAEAQTLLARLPLTLNQAGTNPIPLTVFARSTTGTPNVRSAINWKELR